MCVTKTILILECKNGKQITICVDNDPWWNDVNKKAVQVDDLWCTGQGWGCIVWCIEYALYQNYLNRKVRVMMIWYVTSIFL